MGILHDVQLEDRVAIDCSAVCRVSAVVLWSAGVPSLWAQRSGPPAGLVCCRFAEVAVLVKISASQDVVIAC